MKRKTYMTPAVEAIKVNATEILAGSDVTVSSDPAGGTESNPVSAGAKSGNGDFDFSFNIDE